VGFERRFMLVTIWAQCTLWAFTGKSPGQGYFLSHLAAKYAVFDITWWKYLACSRKW